MVRSALVLALGSAAWLPLGCAREEEEWEFGTAVDAVLDPSLSTSTDHRKPSEGTFQVYAAPTGGWCATWVVIDSPERMERIELWCAADGSGIHGKARVSRCIESETQSGVPLDELSDVQGRIRVNAGGMPSADQHRVVAYSIEGRRGDETIRRAGAFEFGAADVLH